MTARQGSAAGVNKSRATVELLEALKKQCRRARRANLGAEHGVKQMRFGPRTRCLRPKEFKAPGDHWVRWDGAEGQNRTGYAGLFRAALYQ
jgi:hypothetical protein